MILGSQFFPFTGYSLSSSQPFNYAFTSTPHQHSGLSSEKVLIHSGGIGDLLMALPAMRMFRQAFPNATLEMMGRLERQALVAHDLRASLLHSIDQAGMAYFYAEDASLPPRLGAFFSSFGAVLLFGGAGGNILAKNVKRAGAGRVISIPPFPPQALRVHVSDYLVESLGREGIEGENACAPLQLPQETLTAAQSFFAGWGAKEGARILAIHPGSGSPAKNWPAENFAAVADWAAKRVRILLVTGPAEDGAEKVTPDLPRTSSLLGISKAPDLPRFRTPRRFRAPAIGPSPDDSETGSAGLA
jgi:hypothetical protein